RHVVAVRVGDEHQRRATRRGCGKRVEVRGVTDTGVNQDGTAIADEVGPVSFAGHRARVGRVKELRVHPAKSTAAGAPFVGGACTERRPTSDTAKANIINAAAVRYGVVMP